MTEKNYTAHIDTFCHQGLPPVELWPDLHTIVNSEFGYGERLNCAVELLDKTIQQGHADRPCIYWGNEVWSYERLRACSNQIAHVLADDLKLVPGNRVLLRGCHSPLLAAQWLGVLKAGGVCVTTMPLLREQELAYIISKARVSHAFCDASLLSDLSAANLKAPELKNLCVYGSAESSGPHHILEHLIEGKPTDFKAVDTSAADVALIGFTSGTTGKAKGTMHFHRDVLAICDCFPRKILKPEQQDIFCGTPHFAFTFGLGGLLLFPLRVGASTILLEKSGPADICAAIERYKATICFSSPTGYRAMSACVDQHNLSSLKKCVSAGEVLPAATYQLWKDKTGISLIDGIGATEMLHIFISASGDDIRPGSTGKAIPPYEARVVNNDGNLCKPNEVGLLQVRGPTGCRYLNDPDRQKEYVKDGWNTTGDAYSQDENGYFWFNARADDMIISSGYNISGHEVENALLEHPALKECAVVGVPDTERGHIVKAFVVLREPSRAGDDLKKELQDFVKSKIAPYKYPRALDFVAQLPRTETGKLQRFKLRADSQEQSVLTR